MRKPPRIAVLFAVLAAVGGWILLEPQRPDAPVSLAPDIRRDTSAGEPSFRAALPDRAPLQRAAKDPFLTRSWTPPPPKVTANAGPPPAPVAPPLPYRYVGELVLPSGTQVYLARGDDTFKVSEGETLDGEYRVQSLKPGEMVFVHLPTGQQQTMRFSLPGEDNDAQARAILRSAGASAAGPASPAATPAPAPAATPAGAVATAPAKPAAPATPAATAAAAPSGEPAKLRWDGPTSAKAGASFNVALRMTASNQPVRSAPMEVRFDPKLLEPVSVRPGRYFGADGANFGYRINGAGSIYIGVSNRAAPAPANDAELLVLTFKPIKPGTSAELSVAALNLQGPAGRPVAYTALGAFKTTITP